MNYPADIFAADIEIIFAPVKPAWLVELDKENAAREAEDWAIQNEDLLAEIQMEHDANCY